MKSLFILLIFYPLTIFSQEATKQTPFPNLSNNHILNSSRDIYFNFNFGIGYQHIEMKKELAIINNLRRYPQLKDIPEPSPGGVFHVGVGLLVKPINLRLGYEYSYTKYSSSDNPSIVDYVLIFPIIFKNKNETSYTTEHKINNHHFVADYLFFLDSEAGVYFGIGSGMIVSNDTRKETLKFSSLTSSNQTEVSKETDFRSLLLPLNISLGKLSNDAAGRFYLEVKGSYLFQVNSEQINITTLDQKSANYLPDLNGFSVSIKIGFYL